MREEQRKLIDGSRLPAVVLGKVERDVVVRAEARQLNGASFAFFPRVELSSEKSNAFPERAPGARRAAPLDLDDRRRDFDDAGIEVHRTARREMIRSAC